MVDRRYVGRDDDAGGERLRWGDRVRQMAARQRTRAQRRLGHHLRRRRTARTPWAVDSVTAATGGETVVWGTTDGETVVWGTTDGGETVVWGTAGDGETVVWGTSGRRDGRVGHRSMV